VTEAVAVAEKRRQSSETEGVLKALTFEEVQAMMDAAKTPRDRLFLLLLWATAGRRAEVLRLKVMDLRPPDSIILLNEKQHKVLPGEFRPIEHKRLFVPPAVLSEIVAFADSESLDRSAWVFRGVDHVSRLNPTSAWRIVKRAAKAARIFRDCWTEKKGAYQ